MSENRRERFLREAQERNRNQHRNEEIKKLVSRGFSRVGYGLDPFDYTDDFKRVMGNWETPDSEQTSEESLTKAEGEINNRLDDQELVTGLKVTGKSVLSRLSNTYLEVYVLIAKVGRELLWDNSGLNFIEIIDSDESFSRVSWTNNGGDEVLLRVTEGHPLKIKEKFFNSHLRNPHW